MHRKNTCYYYFFFAKNFKQGMKRQFNVNIISFLYPMVSASSATTEATHSGSELFSISVEPVEIFVFFYSYIAANNFNFIILIEYHSFNLYRILKKKWTQNLSSKNFNFWSICLNVWTTVRWKVKQLSKNVYKWKNLKRTLNK